MKWDFPWRKINANNLTFSDKRIGGSQKRGANDLRVSKSLVESMATGYMPRTKLLGKDTYAMLKLKEVQEWRRRLTKARAEEKF